MVFKFFGENSSGGAVTSADKSAIKSEIVLNQQLPNELHKAIIKKITK